jgi:hypothetical protein
MKNNLILYTGPKKFNYIGFIFGEFKVIGYLGKEAGRNKWLVQCSCGNYEIKTSKTIKKKTLCESCVKCKKQNHSIYIKSQKMIDKILFYLPLQYRIFEKKYYKKDKLLEIFYYNKKYNGKAFDYWYLGLLGNESLYTIVNNMIIAYYRHNKTEYDVWKKYLNGKTFLNKRKCLNNKIVNELSKKQKNKDLKISHMNKIEKNKRKI